MFSMAHSAFASSIASSRSGRGKRVFVPAGVPHTYEALGARYLVFLPPRLVDLISQLQQARDPVTDPAIYRTHLSELLE